MGRTDWACVVLIGLVMIFGQPTQVAGLSCLPCEYNTTCACLPENCQKGLRPCGCCYECMGKAGEACSGLMVPCEPGLMCVNSNGVALPEVYWHDFTFRGTCQKVEACQVIVNYNQYDHGVTGVIP